MKIVFTTLLAAALTGCQTSAMHDVNSPAYRIPPGSSLVLNRELSIPAGQRHVKLQHGQPVGGVDDFKVNCQIRVYDLGLEAVRPDTFRITRVDEGREWESLPYRLRFFRVLNIRSEAQPYVLKIICQKIDDRFAGRNISVPQMQEALGDYVTFRFAPATQRKPE